MVTGYAEVNTELEIQVEVSVVVDVEDAVEVVAEALPVGAFAVSGSGLGGVELVQSSAADLHGLT